MNKQVSINLKLRPALQECQLYQMRLHAAWEEAIDFPAIKDGTIQNLTEEQIRTLDQLVPHFAKLQDAMGVRLLPAALHILQEWHDNEAFIDPYKKIPVASGYLFSHHRRCLWRMPSGFCLRKKCRWLGFLWGLVCNFRYFTFCKKREINHA
jgi:hypothetical protein